jgi:hypothetical protein
MAPHTAEHPCIQFNGTSGYTRHGDEVSLFADRIDNPDNTGVTSGHLSLQLWACQSPYAGGELSGWKLAEFPLGVLQPGHFLAPVKSEVPASYPESGDFAMTLVIAEWDGEGFNRIHDFRNCPDREVFLNPRLEGQVAYRCIDQEHLVVDVERICNPREPDNISGTLALELWALAEPYLAGDFQGHALAGVTLGSLAGGGSWQKSAHDMAIVPPPDGSYNLVLMLREWTGNGYVTRDHCNFDTRVSFPLAISATRAAETPIADEASGQFAKPAQSSRQSVEAAPAVGVTSPARETGSHAPQDIAPTGASQSSENLSAQVLRNGPKQFAQRLWDWIKRHW